MVGRRSAALLAGCALAAGCGDDGRPSAAERLQSYTALAQAHLFALRTGSDLGFAEARDCAVRKQSEVAALRDRLVEMGVAPPPEPESIADVDRVLPGLREATDRATFARFTVELDSAARAAWPPTVGLAPPVKCRITLAGRG